MKSDNTGKAYLIGAGPGDPKLLTIRGAEALARADVVVYDRLVHPAILKHARPDAEMIYVGKASSQHTMKQKDINRLLVEKAKEGKVVARLMPSSLPDASGADRPWQQLRNLGGRLNADPDESVLSAEECEAMR